MGTGTVSAFPKTPDVSLREGSKDVSNIRPTCSPEGVMEETPATAQSRSVFERRSTSHASLSNQPFGKYTSQWANTRISAVAVLIACEYAPAALALFHKMVRPTSPFS